LSYPKQCSRDSADHVAQKSVCGNVKNPKVSFDTPLSVRDRAVKGVDVRVRFGETFEITVMKQ
jgi:hypothetical protein